MRIIWHHNNTDGWAITLIEQLKNWNFLRQIELFWMHKLETFNPSRLNGRDANGECWYYISNISAY